MPPVINEEKVMYFKRINDNIDKVKTSAVEGKMILEMKDILKKKSFTSEDNTKLSVLAYGFIGDNFKMLKDDKNKPLLETVFSLLAVTNGELAKYAENRINKSYRLAKDLKIIPKNEKHKPYHNYNIISVEDMTKKNGVKTDVRELDEIVDVKKEKYILEQIYNKCISKTIDPFYHKNSKEYKEMREAIRTAANYAGASGHGGSEKDAVKYAFKRVEDAALKYINAKSISPETDRGAARLDLALKALAQVNPDLALKTVENINNQRVKAHESALQFAMILPSPVLLKKEDYVQGYMKDGVFVKGIKDESPYEKAVSHLKSKDKIWSLVCVGTKDKAGRLGSISSEGSILDYIVTTSLLSDIEATGEQKYNELVKEGKKEAILSDREYDGVYNKFKDSDAFKTIMNKMRTEGYSSRQEMYKDFINTYAAEVEAEAAAKAEAEAAAKAEAEAADAQAEAAANDDARSIIDLDEVDINVQRPSINDGGFVGDIDLDDDEIDNSAMEIEPLI